MLPMHREVRSMSSTPHWRICTSCWVAERLLFYPDLSQGNRREGDRKFKGQGSRKG